MSLSLSLLLLFASLLEKFSSQYEISPPPRAPHPGGRPSLARAVVSLSPTIDICLLQDTSMYAKFTLQTHPLRFSAQKFICVRARTYIVHLCTRSLSLWKFECSCIFRAPRARESTRVYKYKTCTRIWEIYWSVILFSLLLALCRDGIYIARRVPLTIIRRKCCNKIPTMPTSAWCLLFCERLNRNRFFCARGFPNDFRFQSPRTIGRIAQSGI
jgi:hypothetical protein